MEAGSLPTFDLVVATVGRTAEVEALLGSLESQTWSGFRVIVVDQNDDDRLEPILARHGGLTLAHTRSGRGLSRARNAALPALTAEVVGFPDDDCTYPGDLLERVAGRFAGAPALDGLTGRTAGSDGPSPGDRTSASRVLDRGSLWRAGNSASTFLRLALVERVGPFDEKLGLGSGTPWSSGEDTDYLARAVGLGARIEHHPDIVVIHAPRAADDGLSAIGRREGGAAGYILGKHRYPAPTVARMLTRPLGGILVSLGRGDIQRARFHAQTLVGRIRGYVAGRGAV